MKPSYLSRWKLITWLVPGMLNISTVHLATVAEEERIPNSSALSTRRILSAARSILESL